MSSKNIEALRKMSKNLRKFRAKYNYTQLHVSFNASIDISLYQKYESNNPPDIRLTNLLKLLNFYNISLSTLLK